MDVEGLVQKYPKLSFLKSTSFLSLSQEDQDFLLGCVEDALFWIELEKKPDNSDGFKFLAATFGLHKAEEEAKSKGLEGEAREEFLAPIKEVYSKFNPYAC